MAMAWQLHPRLPLILAANRDEFHDREASPMAWWHRPEILAGRDLRAGGTWLGLNRRGRIGLLTNVREPELYQAGLPSRGDLVPMWLGETASVPGITQQLQARTTNGYNLLGIDLACRQAYYWSNRHEHRCQLEPGVYGLSNASLDTPWPKLLQLKAAVTRVHAGVPPACNEAAESEAVEFVANIKSSLLNALADREHAADEQLPSTGISLEWERWLSSVFIQMPGGQYGTRCSTVIVAEQRSQGPLQVHAFEKTWNARGQAVGIVEHTVAISEAAVASA